MVQFARPDADQATGSWTTTPLWSKVDEGSDGGDTIASEALSNGVASSLADLRLSDVTDPVSSADHIIRARWATSSARDITPFCELWLGIPGSGTLIATLAPAVLGDATEITDTYTLSGTEADNITDYTDLYLRLRGTGFGGGPARSLVVEFCEFETPNAGSPPTPQAVSGSMTPAGSLQKVVISGLDGSITSAGSLQKEISHGLDGSFTSTGSLNRLINKILLGASIPFGDITANKVIMQLLSGSMTPSGDITRQITKILNGSTAPTGSIVKFVQQVLSGATALAGDLATQFIPGSGTTFFQTNTGSTTPSGDIATQALLMKSISGTSTPTGTIKKLINKVVDGSNTPSGTVQKQINKILIASITPSGKLEKRIETVLNGSLTPTGTVITAVVILVQVTGQIIITGTLATLFIAGAGLVKFTKKVFKAVFRNIFKDT